MFEKIKRAIIRIGKNKRMLPFALAALLLLYGGKVAAHFCFLLTQRMWKSLRRSIAFILCVCMVFTMPVPLNAGHPQEEDNIVLSDFSQLPVEVREQTVPAGTLLEELNLPNTLDAVVYSRVENALEEQEEGEGILSDSDAADDSGQPVDTEGIQVPPSETDAETTESEQKEGSQTPAEPEQVEGSQTPAEPEQVEGSQAPAEPEQVEGSQTPAEPEQVEGSQTPAEPKQEEGAQAASESGQEEGVAVSTETVVLPPTYAMVQEQQKIVVLSATFPATSSLSGGDLDTGLQEAESSVSGKETILSNTEKNTVTISGVTWNSEPVYNPDAEGTYCFTAVLPKGYALGEGLALPQITVRVREADALPQILVRGYNEETSSDMVLYLEQAWDAYLWESCQDGQWTPIEGETGPELHLTKDEFLTLGYRCRVTSWGAEILSQAYWAIPADLTSQVSRFSMLRAAAGGQSDYLKWDVPASSGRTPFNILGMPGSYKTTYANNGYYTRALVNGNYVNFNSRVTDCAIGGNLFASLDFTPIADGRYLQITYIVENRGAQTQEFQIGSSADIMIDRNDRAPIKGAGSGTYRLIMSDGKDHQLDLVVPGASTLWYGHYSGIFEYSTIFCGERYDGNSNVYGSDSGIAYSWEGSVAPGETWTKYALIGTGPQTTPGLLLNPVVTPTSVNTEVTISGELACDTNCTVYATLGDDSTKHTLYTGSSGSFSTKLDMSGVADGPCELRLWAVDAGGATSDLYSFSLDVLHPSPQISLSESAITLEEASAIGDPTVYFQGFIDSSVGTITIDYGDFTTAGSGVYTVRYTASMDGKPSATEELTVTVTSRALELEVKDPVRAEGANSFTLSALVKYPGPTAFSETGFVWGISQNPTLQVNTGAAATGVSVGKGDEIVVTAADLVEGLTYYARPYVILEGGSTFYGGQTTFSIGGKSYGTFSVANNGNSTFTITRSGGSDGEQKVYYRTVNGSAVGGTHFTHAAGSLTFEEGEISKTVTVSGENTNAPYGGTQTTAYSNAARTYQLEIYKVEGGGLLSNQPRATRTLEGHQSVDRNLYNSIVNAAERGNWTISDSEAAGPNLRKGRNGENRSFPFGIMDLYPSETKDYLNGTATGFYYRFSIEVAEQTDGWEHVWVGTQEAVDTSATGKDSGDPIPLNSSAGTALYTASFELQEGKPSVTLNLPADGTNTRYTYGKPYKSNSVSLVSHPLEPDGEKYLYLDRPNDQVRVHFGACGSGNDIWSISQFNRFVGLSDNREPQFLGIAPMAGGTYKPGDTFYLSLVFDEIVDSANSAGLPQSTRLQTNYGEMTYVGGLDTNVLVFQGKVPDNATGNIQLNSITGIEHIKDLCSWAGGSATASGGSVSITVDSTTPTVSISENSAETGMLAAQITATNFSTLQYVWSGSSIPPSSGWSIYQTGEELQVRQSADTKYLHARAIWENTGRATYAVKEFTFSVDDIVMPELTLSVDNTAWATSRTISVTRSHSDATVTYSGPESGTATGGSVIVTQNGTYTFTLTYGSETVVRQVAVSRLDGTAPLTEVSGPSASAAYGGAISVSVAASDSGGSGMKSLSGVWSSNSGTTREASGMSLAGGNVACPDEEGQWTLTITATDNAGNTATAVSGTYTIVKKQPSVAVNRSSSSNKGDVYTYTVTIPDGVTLDTITLPDGSATQALTGTFTLTQPGTWYLLVSDTFGHVVASNGMVVSAGVDGTPPEVRLSASTEEWTRSLTITASVSDNVEPTSSTWKLGNASPTDLALEVDVSAQHGNAAKAGSFTAAQNGVYTVTAKDAKDNTGSATIEIKNIDTTAPTISMELPDNRWHAADVSIRTVYSDSESGIKTAKYAITTSNSGPTPIKLSDLPSSGSSFSIKESGTLYIYYCVTDCAGNVREGYSDPILLDMTTPSLQVSGNPTAWTNQPVTLNLEASAPSFSGQSLAVKKNNEDFKTITEKKYTVEENGNYQFTVTTGAGKIATKTITVTKIDRTAPANATLTLNPASPDTGSWYKALTIGVAQPQADSGAPITTYYKLWQQGSEKPANGIALSHDATSIPTPGDGKWNVLVYTQDEAGNRSEDSTTLSFQLDTKAPVIGTLEYQHKAATLWDWIIGKKSLIIVVPVTEEGSGADKIVCSAVTQGGTAPARDVSIEGGKATITFSEEFQGQIEIGCTDKAGNAASPVKVGVSGVIVEERAPQVSFDVPKDTNDAGWHKKAFDVTVKVTDKDNGSISGGLAKVEWKLGDEGTVTTITTPFTSELTDSHSFKIPISVDGQQTIYVQATDSSGNQSNWESVTIKLDTTAPEITGPILTPDQWTNQDVSVSFAISDLTSGIREVTVDGDPLKEKDGKYTFTVSENKTCSIAATDNVGNVQTMEVSITNIDKTSPAGPSVDLSPNVPDGSDDWYRTAPTITATGPQENDSAPVTIYYKLWQQGLDEPADGTALSSEVTAIPTPGDGKWSLLVYTQDEAGNHNDSLDLRKNFQIDTQAPVIGDLAFDPNYQSFWNWVFGKTQLKITIPVTEMGSGATTLHYLLKSEKENEESKTADIHNGVATVIVSGDWKGDLVFWATDLAGNTSAQRSVSSSGTGGVIVENHAPIVSFNMQDASKDDWHNASFDIEVTVTDDDQGSISGGLAKVEWKEDDGEVKTLLGLPGESMQTQVRFSIPVKTDGIHTYSVQATDNSGNQSEWKTITIKLDTKTPTLAVSGGTIGAATLELAVDSGFGPSEGQVTVSGADSGVISDNSYLVTEKGTYIFTATSVAGLFTEVRKNVYSIAFDSAGGSPCPSQLVVENGTATQPENPQRTGYTFQKWQQEEGDYQFTSPVNSDVQLKALWELNPPSLKLSIDRESPTYQGGETAAVLTIEATHVVEGVTYNYQWYKNNELVQNASQAQLKLTELADSGSYTVKVTASKEGLTSRQAESNINVTIGKAPVTFIVSDNDYDYDSSIKKATIEQKPDEIPSISGGFRVLYQQKGKVVDNPVDVGTYDIMVELTDDNFQHSGQADMVRSLNVGTLTIRETIYPPFRDGSMEWPAAAKLTYGQLLSESVLTGGNQSADKGQYTWYEPDTRPTVENSGYQVVFTPADTNYQPVSEVISIDVDPKELTISGAAAKNRDYLPENTDVTVTGGALVGVEKDDKVTLGGKPSGKIATPGADLGKAVIVTGYEIAGDDAENYTLTQPDYVTVDIAKAVGNTDVTMEDWTYGAAAAEPIPVSPTNGIASVTYSYTGTDDGKTPYGPTEVRPTNAGSYQVTATFATTENYLETVAAADFTIKKRPVSATWGGLRHVYDGKEKNVNLLLVGVLDQDVDECSVALSNGERRSAGSHPVTASLTGSRAFNYILTNPTERLMIQKAPVRFTITENSHMYDGNTHTARVTTDTGAPFTITYRPQTQQEGGPEEAAQQSVPGVYDIMAQITDSNYRHNSSVDGGVQKVGTLTIYESQPSQLYTITLNGGEGAMGTIPTLSAAVGELIILPENTLTKADHVFAGWEQGQILYQPGEEFIMPSRNVAFTARWEQATHDIGGVVDQNGVPLSDVIVTLMRGSQWIAETITDNRGKYTFTKVQPGLYNLIATKGGIVMTIKVQVLDSDVGEANIALPEGMTNSVVEVVPGTPKIIVGNLERTFDMVDGTVYTEEDRKVVEDGGMVEIRFTASKLQPDPSKGDALQIEEKRNRQETIGLYLELTLEKIITKADQTSQLKPVPESSLLLESVIPLPANLQGKYSYIVYRVHEGAVHAITQRANEYGEYFVVNTDKTSITLYTKMFSTYAIAYSNPPDSHVDNEGISTPSDERIITSPSEEIITPIDEEEAVSPVSPAPKAPESPMYSSSKPKPKPEDSSGSQKPHEPSGPAEEDLPDISETDGQEAEGRAFALLSALFALAAAAAAGYVLAKKRSKGRRIAACTAAGLALILLFTTCGLDGFVWFNGGTTLIALCAAVAAAAVFWKKISSQSQG